MRTGAAADGNRIVVWLCCGRARRPTISAVAPRLQARASSGHRGSCLGISAHHLTSSFVSG